MSYQRFSNPYVMGVLLGLILLFTFYTMGRGLGSSATFARVGAAQVHWLAPDHATSTKYLSSYLQEERSPLNSWLVFLTLGAGLGALLSAFMANRIHGEVARGPSIGVPA